MQPIELKTLQKVRIIVFGSRTIKKYVVVFSIMRDKSDRQMQETRKHEHTKALRNFLAVFVSLGLWVSSHVTVIAQQAQTAENRLKIVIVGGEEPLRNLKQRVPREVIVEVRDENDKPVGAGAAVTYAVSSRGATQPLGSVITGADGRAVLNFTPNATGNLNVSAALGAQTGSVAVPVSVVTLVPAVTAAAGTAAAAGAGAVAQATVATQDCNGLFDPSSLTMADQVCASGAVSPNTSPQCMSAVQRVLSQFSQLCSCVGGLSVPQLYTQYGLTQSDIDTIGSLAKTVGFTLPPSCTSPTAPTIIRGGPPTLQ